MSKKKFIEEPQGVQYMSRRKPTEKEMEEITKVIASHRKRFAHVAIPAKKSAKKANRIR